MPEKKSNAAADAMQIQAYHFRNYPVVRVKMVEEQEQLDFEVEGQFVLTDEQGNVLKDPFETETRWRAHVDAFTPPKYQYILFVIEVLSEREAEEIAEDLTQKGFEAWYRRFGYAVKLEDDAVYENYRYRVFIGPLPEKVEARSVQTKLLGRYRSQILKVPTKQARGYLEIIDIQSAKALKGVGFLRLEPKSENAKITVYGIRNRDRSMPYTFRHGIEFHIAESGKLFLVGELDVEEYVSGVAAALYREGYPEEFLKASVISYRSSILANLGMNHMNEPYDYCRTEHCYPFIWREEPQNDLLEKILDEVKGQFLLKGGDICDAQQHPVCGGHTEHINLIMNRDTGNAVTGRFDILEDAQELPKDLSNEADAEQWIQSRPPVLCNLKGKENLPDYDQYRKFFRWVIEISRQELDEIVRKKTEEDIGVIYDIVPLVRGRSGRLLELEVLGSHRNVHLLGDMDIRSTLAETFLPSSCFVVEIEMGVDGSPAEFTFIGAGKGHGVGMCQAGAIAQAADGRKFMDILQHYFGKVELTDRFPV